MKLAFSTLGCPDWSFDEIFAAAKDLGFDGIEIRGVENELYAPAVKAFSGAALAKTLERLKGARISVPILTSGACIGGEQEEHSAFSEIAAYMDLAGSLGTSFVRVMVSAKPQQEPCDLALAARLYEKACRRGEQAGVTPLLETNGFFCDTAGLRKFMDRIPSENKGVLWDVHHPYRFHGEKPEQTASNLEGLIRHVHLKDSVLQDGKVSYRMMGSGDIPVSEALSSLKKMGYDGHLSLEWVKRWYPELQEAGIVFAHYVNYMNSRMKQL